MLSLSKSTAVIPFHGLGNMKEEMNVRVITRDRSGTKLTDGGLAVRGILTAASGNKGMCPVTDNDDGTYTVSVTLRQLGKHQLTITVNGESIQDSPFTLNTVPRNLPPRKIAGIGRSRYIAFSDNGDMFVTSSIDHCIHVYDKSGNKKITIGSKGSGKLQFEFPLGIDVSGEVVYVAEYGGHRIHKLTTGGEFISTFGEQGSGTGQFERPYNIKISPDGKVYVADTFNNRVQVFNPDWTISHVIKGGAGSFSQPAGIAFDSSGKVHVTGHSISSSVTVFTPNGQFVHQYGEGHLCFPLGIAINQLGYSLVTSWANCSLSVFDPSGRFVYSEKRFKHPQGVAIQPTDGSVCVACVTAD